MANAHNSTRTLGWTVLAGLVCLVLGQAALADTIVMENNMRMADVRILGIRGEEIDYETSAARASRPLDKVKMIQVDGEAAVNAAENAFVAGKWEDALKNYGKALDAIPANVKEKAWLRDWCSRRRTEATIKTGDVSASVKAFIELARKAPDQADPDKIELPKAGSRFLTESARLLEAALGDANLSLKSKQQLLRMLVKVYTSDNKQAQAAKTADALAAVEVELNPNSPAVARAMVSKKLAEAGQALAAQQYENVGKIVMDVAEKLTEPSQQAAALLMLADAEYGKASAAPSDDAWKDVAVAYMRVVANNPGTLEAGKALLKTALIHETRLKEKAAAQAIYAKTAEEFKAKDKDIAAAAEKEAARLATEKK